MQNTRQKFFINRLWTALLNVVREIGAWAIIELAIALLFLLVLADLTEDVFQNEFTQFDNSIVLWLHQQASPTLNFFFNIFTTVGGIPGVSIMTAVLFGLLAWRKHFAQAWMVLLAVGGGVLINQVLKTLFHRPRPDLWISDNARPTTFSFPSGHSTASLCFFGCIVWLAFKYLHSPVLKILVAALMGLFVLLVGLSRIYFGVHYPTDVIAGYLSGSIWLLALLSSVKVKDFIAQRRHRQTKQPTVESRQS